MQGATTTGDPSGSLQRLEQEERAISRRRRQLHDRIDFLCGSGLHDPETLDRLACLEAEEKEVSAQRRQLHDRSDTLRSQVDGGARPESPPAEEGLLDNAYSALHVPREQPSPAAGDD